MITGVLCLFSVSAFGQVGINTQTPAATLDVAARTTGTSTTTAEGLIAPRLTLADLNAKAAAYGASQAGSLIYVTDAANGSPAGQTANINAAGYYFFDGTAWLKVTTGNAGGSVSSNDIYNGDGALTANRTVAMSDKTLAFSANPTGGTSHFTVDDTTLSVDALNNRVGIGTNAPSEKLQVDGGNMFMHHDSPTLYFQSTIPNNSSNSNSNNGSVVFYEGTNSTAEGMYMRHVNNPTNYSGRNFLQFGSIDNGTYNPIMNIANLSQQVLINSPTVVGFDGTIFPKLSINSNVANGAIQIVDGTQGNNKVLTSDASGKASWKTGILAAPSTTYTWDNSGASGTLGYYQNYVYGPYTVGKTGWYEIQSKWRYIQSPSSVSGGDQGVGSVWMQINTSGNNNMYALTDAPLSEQPIDETIVANQLFSTVMLSGRMLYLTSGKNYFIHIIGAYVDVVGSQNFILNYVQ
ncbi:hypothetical protein CHA01nite_39520 [Chryseobacterium hagamense]|uniref:Uncharacterized protein n=2 Tax=Chryseobacterium hagamense TaxID=395935 RepID=A0A511YSQ6_9FLAO|nr:hypothetical protein CHA01nite_39520 [Chryseobacterium hagamense]